MKTKMKSVRCGPENWVQTLPLLAAVLESGTAEGKRMARAELTRMAKVADLAVKHEASHGVLVRLVGNFPGFVDDSEVNGGDLVEWLANEFQALECPEFQLAASEGSDAVLGGES